MDVFIKGKKHSNRRNNKKLHGKKKTSAKIKDVEVKLCQAKNSKPQLNEQKCFMVGIDMDHKDTVYGETFWPSGIIFQRFNFFPGKNVLDQKQTGVPPMK